MAGPRPVAARKCSEVRLCLESQAGSCLAHTDFPYWPEQPLVPADLMRRCSSALSPVWRLRLGTSHGSVVSALHADAGAVVRCKCRCCNVLHAMLSRLSLLDVQGSMRHLVMDCCSVVMAGLNMLDYEAIPRPHTQPGDQGWCGVSARPLSTTGTCQSGAAKISR